MTDKSIRGSAVRYQLFWFETIPILSRGKYQYQYLHLGFVNTNTCSNTIYSFFLNQYQYRYPILGLNNTNTCNDPRHSYLRYRYRYRYLQLGSKRYQYPHLGSNDTNTATHIWAWTIQKDNSDIFTSRKSQNF